MATSGRPRGMPKTGGRQKGTSNKHKYGFRMALRAYCEQLEIDPHRFMADMIADNSMVTRVAADGTVYEVPACDRKLKFEAAKELAQYIEPKLKAIDHTGAIDQTVKIVKVTLE